MKDALKVFEEERKLYLLMYFEEYNVRSNHKLKSEKTEPENLNNLKIRKMRAPSKYNMFVKEKMKELSGKYSTKECMKQCAKMWKEHKLKIN